MSGDVLRLIDPHISNIVASWTGADKVKRTPLPYPYVQLLNLVLGVWVFSLPLTLAHLFGWLTPLISAVVAIALLGINEVASEIAMPFGTDPNDLDLDKFADVASVDVLSILAQRDVSLWLHDATPDAPKQGGDDSETLAIRAAHALAARAVVGPKARLKGQLDAKNSRAPADADTGRGGRGGHGAVAPVRAHAGQDARSASRPTAPGTARESAVGGGGDSGGSGELAHVLLSALQKQLDAQREQFAKQQEFYEQQLQEQKRSQEEQLQHLLQAQQLNHEKQLLEQRHQKEMQLLQQTLHHEKQLAILQDAISHLDRSQSQNVSHGATYHLPAEDRLRP